MITSYNYENALFAPLKEPGRNVVAAYQNAARFLDTLKEWVLIEGGMIYASEFLHELAHLMPGRFDAFGDILHDYHLMVFYPATPELVEDVQNMDIVFAIALDTLDDITAALKAFNSAAKGVGLDELVPSVDKLLEENRASYRDLLQAQKMWSVCKEPGTFDSWMRKAFVSPNCLKEDDD